MNYLIGAFVGILFLILLAFALKNRGPLDDTDNKLTGARSNLQIVIDHGTGCQYLVTARGGITPRLDAKGGHMFVKEAA